MTDIPHDVVMRLPGWELRARRNSALRYYVAHTDCSSGDTYGWMAWASSDMYARCFGCRAVIPTEIETVMILLEGR
jgi:hypothetical protein